VDECKPLVVGPELRVFVNEERTTTFLALAAGA